MTIWRLRISRQVAKATNTFSKYVILISFPLQQWLHERAAMLRHAYVACLIFKTALFCLVYLPNDTASHPRICPNILVIIFI